MSAAGTPYEGEDRGLLVDGPVSRDGLRGLRSQRVSGMESVSILFFRIYVLLHLTKASKLHLYCISTKEYIQLTAQQDLLLSWHPITPNDIPVLLFWHD